MRARPEPRRMSGTEFRDKIASGEIAVWCYCYDSPEPAGWWAPPDDVHADTCCIDRDRAPCTCPDSGGPWEPDWDGITQVDPSCPWHGDRDRSQQVSGSDGGVS